MQKRQIYSQGIISSVFIDDNTRKPVFDVHVNDSVKGFTCSVSDIIKSIGKVKESLNSWAV